jgi:hypothetical protein
MTDEKFEKAEKLKKKIDECERKLRVLDAMPKGGRATFSMQDCSRVEVPEPLVETVRLLLVAVYENLLKAHLKDYEEL